MKKSILCLLIGSLVFSLGACTKKQDQKTTDGSSQIDESQYYGTVTPKHGPDEIWLNNREEPQYMDPILASGVPDGNLAMNTFARLVQIDPKTGTAAPDLAVKWEAFDEGTRYIFTMRPNLKWSDGQPLTAHDFEYSWKRLIAPETGAQYASLGYTTFQGGEAFARQAVLIEGFKAKPNIEGFVKKLTSQGVSVEKVVPRFASNDVFVFVSGEDKKTQRERVINLYSKDGYKSRVASSDDVHVKALSDNQLEVRLTGPLPYFVTLVEFTCFGAVPRHVLDRIAKENNGDISKWTRAENMVASGAYKLVKENFKIDKIYEKNPYYWDAANVKTNRIRILMIETENAVMNAYKVGEVDWIGPHEVPAEQLNQLKAFKDFYNDPYLGVYSYTVNHKVKPLDDVRVRRALSLAIDRESLTKNVLGGAYIPYGGIVPDGLGGYKGYQQELYNPEKAKQLLAEAGYPNGEGFPKFKFKYDTKDIHRLIIQAVQQMWKDTLGIEVEPVNVEWKVYLDDLDSHRFEITRTGWIGDFLDPFTFLELELSNSGNNYGQWENPTYDKLIEDANKQADAAKRFEMLYEAEKMAVDEVSRMPLYLYTKTYMLKPYIKGFYKDYQDHHLWKHMWVDVSRNK